MVPTELIHSRDCQREYCTPCPTVGTDGVLLDSTAGTGAITRVVVDRGYGEGMGMKAGSWVLGLTYGDHSFV